MRPWQDYTLMLNDCVSARWSPMCQYSALNLETCHYKTHSWVSKGIDIDLLFLYSSIFHLPCVCVHAASKGRVRLIPRLPVFHSSIHPPIHTHTHTHTHAHTHTYTRTHTSTSTRTHISTRTHTSTHTHTHTTHTHTHTHTHEGPKIGSSESGEMSVLTLTTHHNLCR